MQIQAEDELVKYVVKRKGWGSHQTVLRPFSHHPSYSLSKRSPLWWTKDKRGEEGKKHSSLNRLAYFLLNALPLI